MRIKHAKMFYVVLELPDVKEFLISQPTKLEIGKRYPDWTLKFSDLSEANSVRVDFLKKGFRMIQRYRNPKNQLSTWYDMNGNVVLDPDDTETIYLRNS